MNSSQLYDMIFKRKSFHLFKNPGIISDEELRQIQNQYLSFEALIPSVHTKIEIVPAGETSCARGEEYCILFYSEVKNGYLQNIGYLGEQMDLYLASMNIGALWFGIGKTELPLDGYKFVIMMAIAKIPETAFRIDMYKSKRKTLEEIWEGPLLPFSNILRFAPSACNSQPWHVKHDGSTLEICRWQQPGKRGIMPADRVTYYNRIDIGIFLLFLDLCLKENQQKYTRILSPDLPDSEESMILTARYIL